MTQHCINDPEKVSETQKTLLSERENLEGNYLLS